PSRDEEGNSRNCSLKRGPPTRHQSTIRRRSRSSITPIEGVRTAAFGTRRPPTSTEFDGDPLARGGHGLLAARGRLVRQRHEGPQLHLARAWVSPESTCDASPSNQRHWFCLGSLAFARVFEGRSMSYVFAPDLEVDSRTLSIEGPPRSPGRRRESK
ncbi:MAG: hypothetical protein ACI9OJ_003367, partial [Myxococcota bacterium]